MMSRYAALSRGELATLVPELLLIGQLIDRSGMAWCISEFGREEIAAERLQPPLPPHDLAYLIVRIVESFLYADIITGEEPDIAMVEHAIGALLGRGGAPP